jgi:uncharacterized protein with WD repeat
VRTLPPHPPPRAAERVHTVKNEDGSQHKNLRVFSVSTGAELAAFSQKAQDGWDVQYTIAETHAVRLVGPEVHVLDPADWARGVVDKLRVEGATSVALSPGLSPSLAVFVGEKKVGLSAWAVGRRGLTRTRHRARRRK